MFFAEGGQQCWVTRVVGPAASLGTLTLNDKAGSPLPTLRVDAANFGAWSANLQVQVSAGLLTNTFRITVTLSGVIVEDYNNLATPAAAVSKFAQSKYVRVTDLGSATAAPNNIPAVLAATSLTAGADDRSSITSAMYYGALANFVPGLGDGAVSIPGQGAAVHAGIIAHCVANNRIAILGTTRGASVSDLLATATSLNSEYAGLFAPWVNISDGAGGQRAVSPEGYVAACRARAVSQVGPWEVPAGLTGVAATLLSLDQAFSASDGNTLDSGNVSAIRVINNTIRLYGWRSCSTDQTNYQFLSIRDLLNRLVVGAESVLEDFVFQPVDGKGHLQTAIYSALVGMVDPISQAGGLYALYSAAGKIIDPGDSIDTSSAVNSTSSLAGNQVKALLEVRPSPNAAMISLSIVKVPVLGGF
jgi:phage tail sheath protein FI